MRSRFVLLIAAASLLFITAACSNTPVSPPLASRRHTTVAMSLEIGNEWIGRRSMNGGYVYDTVRIVGDTMINGEKWYRSPYDLLYGNRSDGIYTWRPLVSVKPERQVKFPLMTGDTAVDYGWFHGTDTAGTAGDSVRVFGIVTAAHQEVSVPAGGFTCWKVQIYNEVRRPGRPSSIQSGDQWLYVAPGVGLVKEERVGASFSGPFVATSWELVKFTLK